MFGRWAIANSGGWWGGTPSTLLTWLTAYYKADTNGSFPDAVWSNDWTIDGASYTTSWLINNAYDFDGVNDNITFGSWGIGTTDDWSISFWLYLDTNQRDRTVNLFGDIRFIIAHDDNSQNDGSLHWYDWSWHDTWYNVGNGAWNHYVVTYDYSATTIKIYVDTTQRLGNTSTTFTSGTATNQVSNPSLCFDGRFDEFGVWSKVLTSSEIAELYNSWAGNQYPF